MIIKTVTRYHDFSYGHRIVGTGPEFDVCGRLHGHNARVYFTVEGEADKSGHIVDFAAIKATYCDWLERNWDHRMLLYKEDNLFDFLKAGVMHKATLPLDKDAFIKELGLVALPVNPTAENLAEYLLVILRASFPFPNARLVKIKWEETRKCSVEVVVTQKG